MSTIDLTTTGPLTRDEAMALQAAELDATLELLRSLTADEWHAPVPDCPGWDVRSMYLHVLGACEGAALPEMGRQMVAAMRRRRRDGGPLEASLSAVQIDARSALTPEQLIDRLVAAAPLTVERRTRLPGFARRAVSMKVDGPVVERWKLGYLVDTIYLRDLWMHRIDACLALGREPHLAAAHDGRIVADVVGEWTRRHGRGVALTLTGPAGGSFVAGDGAEHLTLDAVVFCRTLAGRLPADGLMATVVPF